VDERRFDDLVRTLGATGRSRRAVLKGLMAGAIGGAVGLLTAGGAAAGNNGNGNGNGTGNGNSKKPDCCPSSAPRLCGTQCVDFTSDPNNCGACDNVCPHGSTCQNGACMCPAGTTLCGNVCVDTTNDVNNCGACDNPCAPGSTCQGGACVSSSSCTSDLECPGGFRCESGTCLDMCASDFDCKAGFHCSSGVCVANQLCTPTDTRPCYTGPAGTAGVGTCQYGIQTCAADGTWGPCVGEVLPQTETCNNLDDDCNGVVDDGFDKQNDPNNCGTCGHVCTTPNGTPGCVNGQCTVAACDEGWSDCDGNPANGCEENVSSDVNNCGGCHIVCGTGEICTNGSCHPSCPESSICAVYTFDSSSGTCSAAFLPPGTVCGANQVCDGSGTCVTVTGP